MKFFEGEQGHNIEQTAVALLKVHLGGVLKVAPNASTFGIYGGVRLLDDDTLAERGDEDESMRPEVFLSIDEHSSKVWKMDVEGVERTGDRHEIKVSAEILTSDSCFKAEPKLRDAICEAVRGHKKALRLAGWFEAACDPNPARVNDQNKVNPMLVSGVFYTLR